MKFVINGKFLSQPVTGVQRYAREILLELDKIASGLDLTIVIPSDAKDVPDYQKIKKVQVGGKGNIRWEQFAFPRFVRKQHAISLNLCNVAPLVNPGIVCIHDVKVNATPQFFSKKFLLWYHLLFKNETKRAKKILTVSEFSKSEIQKYYQVSSDRILVIPNGWQHFSRTSISGDSLQKFGLEKDSYYFGMGSLEPNKNFKWIAEVAQKNPKEAFVVAGSINEKIFTDGLGFDCPANMKLVGYVSDEDSKSLMCYAKAFLFPSFYEGFGIPPLEAISAGCRRIFVSDTAVMHELFEGEAIYIDPHDSSSFHVTDASFHEAERILDKYSWNLSATQLKHFLESIS